MRHQWTGDWGLFDPSLGVWVILMMAAVEHLQDD
jgi:hypothetical protein